MTFLTDEEMQEKMLKKRAFNQKLMFVFSILLVVGFISIFVFNILFGKKGKKNLTIEYTQEVLSYLTLLIENNNLTEYQNYFSSPLSKQEKELIQSFNKNRGDRIEYQLLSTSLQIFPTGVSEIKAEITRLFLINHKTIQDQVIYFILKKGNRIQISFVPYNLKAQYILTPMNTPKDVIDR